MNNFILTVGKWIAEHQVGILSLAVCLAVSIPLSIIVSWIIRLAVKIMLKKSKKDEDKISDSINKPVIFAGILTGLVCGLRMLNIPEAALAVINRIYFVITVLIVAWALLRVLSVVRLLLQEMAKKTENVYDDLLVSLIYPVVKGVVWVMVVFFIAENVFNLVHEIRFPLLHSTF